MADDLIHWAYAHFIQGFHTSALLIALSARDNSPLRGLIVAKSLLALGHHPRIHAFLRANESLLQYKEIALASIAAGMQPPPSQPTLSVPLPQPPDGTPFSYASLEQFHIALNKKETVRKSALIRAFKADTRNMEPLVRLLGESLATRSEIKQLLRTAIPPDTPSPYAIGQIESMLSYASPDPICPLSIHLQTAALYARAGYEEFFHRSILSHELFPSSEYTSSALGLYYLYRREYKQAKACFIRAVSLNPHFGHAYMCRGVLESITRESEKALSLLSVAYNMMPNAFLPAYYLAYEFQQMNNFPKAKYFYERALAVIERNLASRLLSKGPRPQGTSGEKCPQAQAHQLTKPEEAVVNAAIYCMIYFEDYTAGESYLKQFSISNLLSVYCSLFTGSFEDARRRLDGCHRDALYYATRGYMAHLGSEYAEAVADYERSCGMERMKVVESLMGMALQNLAGRDENSAFDYSNCLFDELEYKRRLTCMFGV